MGGIKVLVEIMLGAKTCKEANKVAKPDPKIFDFNDKIEAASYERQRIRWWAAEETRKIYEIDYDCIDNSYNQRKKLILDGYPVGLCMTAVIVNGKAQIQPEKETENLI
jgi:hypothetical protein